MLYHQFELSGHFAVFLVIDTRRPRPRVVPATLSVIWTGASGAGDAFAAVEHRLWQKKGRVFARNYICHIQTYTNVSALGFVGFILF